MKRALLAGVHEMHRTDETGIVRADDVTQFHWVIQILDLQTDETFLSVSASPRGIARRGVPRSRRDDLIVRDLALPDLYPMPQAPPRGIDQAIAVGIHARFRLDESRLAEMLHELLHGVSHRLQHSNGPMQPGKLPQPSMPAFGLEKRGDQRISGDHQIGKRTELHDPILITGSFDIAVSPAVGLIFRRGFTVPGMASTARIDKPGIAHM